MLHRLRRLVARPARGRGHRGAWFVVDADPADLFTADPDHLWRSVLARQPNEAARIALVPEDPTSQPCAPSIDSCSRSWRSRWRSACSADEPGGSPAAGTGTGARKAPTTPTRPPAAGGAPTRCWCWSDSLVNGARLFGDLGDRLDAAGFRLPRDRRRGRRARVGVEQVEDMDEVPEVVVVELGTSPDADPDGFAEVAATTSSPPSGIEGPSASWLTPVHEKATTATTRRSPSLRPPGLGGVADWASVVRDDRAGWPMDSTRHETATATWPDSSSSTAASLAPLTAGGAGTRSQRRAPTREDTDLRLVLQRGGRASPLTRSRP